MAGSKKDVFETEILQHIFQNAAIANIGNAGGLQPSSVAGNFYIALYTTAYDDASAGTEANYTGYARVAVPRSASGFSVANGVAANAAAVTFPLCTAGNNTILSACVCTGSVAGVNDAKYGGDLAASLSVSQNITPEIAAGAFVINEG
jgi:hypothetical protein